MMHSGSLQGRGKQRLLMPRKTLEDSNTQRNRARFLLHSQV